MEYEANLAAARPNTERDAARARQRPEAQSFEGMQTRRRSMTPTSSRREANEIHFGAVTKYRRVMELDARDAEWS